MTRYSPILTLLCLGALAAPSAAAQARPMGLLNLPGLNAPVIRSVDTSGAVLDIKGLHLGDGKPTVAFNGAAQTVTVVSSGEVTIPAPAGLPSGTYLLVLTTPYGNTASFTVALGTQGATGPQGPQGPAGSMGPVGPMGMIGPMGPAGAQGPAGPQGAKGDTGAVGPTGLQGPIGTPGLTGPAGPAGPQGLQGAQGQQGPVGPQGLTGLQGAKGDTGAVGPTGLQGPIGATGATGLTGPAGPQGPQGAQGNQGIQGPIGFTGATGPQGLPGAQGPQGPMPPAISAIYLGEVTSGSVKVLGVHYIICMNGIFPSRGGGGGTTEAMLGEVKLFAGNFAPDGWALCDGQLLSIAQYTALFSILGTTYGGDGRTTFALPDLRAAVPMEPNE